MVLNLEISVITPSIVKFIQQTRPVVQVCRQQFNFFNVKNCTFMLTVDFSVSEFIIENGLFSLYDSLPSPKGKTVYSLMGWFVSLEAQDCIFQCYVSQITSCCHESV